MNEARLTYWQSYFNQLKDLMGLRDWVLELQDEPPEDKDHIATVGGIVGRKVAKVWVCAEWEARPPEEQRHTVIHELTHLHFEQLNLFVYDGTKSFMSPREDKVFYDTWKFLFEYGIDAVALVIAPMMPLPISELATIQTGEAGV